MASCLDLRTLPCFPVHSEPPSPSSLVSKGHHGFRWASQGPELGTESPSTGSLTQLGNHQNACPSSPPHPSPDNAFHADRPPKGPSRRNFPKMTTRPNSCLETPSLVSVFDFLLHSAGLGHTGTGGFRPHSHPVSPWLPPPLAQAPALSAVSFG